MKSHSARMGLARDQEGLLEQLLNLTLQIVLQLCLVTLLVIPNHLDVAAVSAIAEALTIAVAIHDVDATFRSDDLEDSTSVG
jgi:hypothetical protein